METPKHKILYLTLKKQPFEVMITGEKPYEFRDVSQWMKSRLMNKDGTRREYDWVWFTNGYGSTLPAFVAEYKGFETVSDINETYSNGLTVRFAEEKYKILLGRVLFRLNLE